MLVTHRPEAAIAQFEKAVLQEPPDATLLSDLAAAYLARAATGQPHDLVHALVAADRALEKCPDLAAARFNLALALDRLGLRQEAQKAWGSYLAIDSGSNWSAEARRRLRALAEPTDTEIWRRSLQDFSPNGPGDRRATARDTALRFPEFARVYAEEELLLGWASALSRGDPEAAQRQLRIARAIAEALDWHGDALLRDAIAAIDRARLPAVLEHLVIGHLAYGEGLDLARRDYRQAALKFSAARLALARANSPFAGWAEFRLAQCDYQRSDYTVALSRLAQLLERTAGTGYSSLQGRASWLTGTIRLLQARPTESLAAYSAALARFEHSGETGNALAIHTLIASSLSLVGDTRGSWEHRFRALAALRRLLDPQRLMMTLDEAASALFAEGEARAALYFENELLPQIRAAGEAAPIAATLRQRAQLLQRLGRTELALRDLDIAKGFVARITDTDVREGAAGETALVEGTVRAESDPAAALTALDTALRIAQKTDYRFFLPRIYLARARLDLARGDDHRAGQSLSAGIEECDLQRGGIADDSERISYLDQVHDLFAEIIRFQIERKNDSVAALSYLERSRSRTLFDALARGDGQVDEALPAPNNTSVFDASRLSTEIPPNTTIVEYWLGGGDRMAIWVMRRGFLAMRQIAVDTRRLTHAIQLLEHANDEARFDRLSAYLHTLLLGPVRSFITPGSLLVVIPDASLYGVPFAALRNAATARFVIEDTPVVIAPSARAFLHCFRRCRKLFQRPPRTVLAVGDPRVRRDLFLDLQMLPGSAAEARAVAAHYSKATILLDERATKDLFLHAAVDNDVIHFAGHSLPNLRSPFLSSLLLAPDPRNGDRGILYANELLGNRLEHTRLVVLSACDTARGPSSPSEGVLGFSLPLLAAGVPTVLASLWRVDDRAASQLFDRFHTYITSGIDPAAALRFTVIDLLRSADPSGRAPHAWAAFEIIGGSSAGPIN
ncbi:MAG TPA: CHAT domain-containing protein [Thermoanaerobaculia bacterium]|nr:CHAT domain-containing protein [Thermoanaerobaculia bacterium]